MSTSAELITIDNVTYHAHIQYESLERSFALIEGQNSGVSITQRDIIDIIGTKYSYRLNIIRNEKYPYDYDSLYTILSSPVPYHTVTLPFNQSTKTFYAKVLSGTDKYKGVERGIKIWDELSIEIVPIEPQVYAGD